MAKYKCIVEYEYPVDHKPPVKAEIILHGDSVTSNNVTPFTDRPHGEWIFRKYDKDYECSNCHVRFDRTQIYTEKRFENALWAKMKIYNFCPNCGADMRKEGDRNDTV